MSYLSIIVVTLILIISGCVSDPPLSSNTRSIEWVEGTTRQINNICSRLGGPYNVEACAVMKGDHCTIYAPRFKHENDDKAFVRIGEEVAHCFYGDFH